MTQYIDTESFDDIAKTERRDAPDRGWSGLRARPVRREPDGRWIVSGYPELRALLPDPRLSSVRTELVDDPPRERLLLVMDGLDAPAHEGVRRHMMRSFGPPWHPRRVTDLEAAITTITTQMLDSAAAGTRMDVVDDFTYPIPVFAICTVLGLPAEDHLRFAEWMRPFSSARTIEETSIGLNQSRALARPYLAEMLARRRAEPQDDMITGLATDSNEGRAPDDEQIVENLFLLFVGGHETTINAVASAILLLLRNPAVLERLRADPRLIPATFEEVLRLEPPLQMFDTRHALADIPIGDEVIPAGAKVTLVNAAANRDPRRFHDPDAFDIDRVDNEHLSFQAGPHYCFGAPMARMEARIMLTEWIRRVENPRLVVDPPPYRPNPIVRGPLHLLVDYDRIGPPVPLPATGTITDHGSGRTEADGQHCPYVPPATTHNGKAGSA